MNQTKRLEILLVEDNPGDIRLTREAFKQTNIRNNLSIATDGEMAMEFLLRKNEFANAPEPSIILLDLNLPKKDGRQVLNEIKQNVQLKKIPVIILSTSENDHDISNSYENHANCYLTKPIDFDSFTKVIRQMQNFWLSLVKLPSTL